MDLQRAPVDVNRSVSWSRNVFWLWTSWWGENQWSEVDFPLSYSVDAVHYSNQSGSTNTCYKFQLRQPKRCCPVCLTFLLSEKWPSQIPLLMNWWIENDWIAFVVLFVCLFLLWLPFHFSRHQLLLSYWFSANTGKAIYHFGSFKMFSFKISLPTV